MRRLMPVAALVLLLGGCYHATVQAPISPGQKIERRWAHSFLGGLVPPAPVETGTSCPNGIARVETKLSALNMLVGWMTGYIYTPMSIEVWCAFAPASDAPGTAAAPDSTGSGQVSGTEAPQAATAQR